MEDESRRTKKIYRQLLWHISGSPPSGADLGKYLSGKESQIKQIKEKMLDGISTKHSRNVALFISTNFLRSKRKLF